MRARGASSKSVTVRPHESTASLSKGTPSLPTDCDGPKRSRRRSAKALLQHGAAHVIAEHIIKDDERLALLEQLGELGASSRASAAPRIGTSFSSTGMAAGR